MKCYMGKFISYHGSLSESLRATVLDLLYEDHINIKKGCGAPCKPENTLPVTVITEHWKLKQTNKGWPLSVALLLLRPSRPSQIVLIGQHAVSGAGGLDTALQGSGDSSL